MSGPTDPAAALLADLWKAAEDNASRWTAEDRLLLALLAVAQAAIDLRACTTTEAVGPALARLDAALDQLASRSDAIEGGK